MSNLSSKTSQTLGPIAQKRAHVLTILEHTADRIRHPRKYPRVHARRTPAPTLAQLRARYSADAVDAAVALVGGRKRYALAVILDLAERYLAERYNASAP